MRFGAKASALEYQPNQLPQLAKEGRVLWEEQINVNLTPIL
jgi:hypothetical protein